MTAPYDIQRLASFTADGKGGNPAGVVIAGAFPDDKAMLAIAAEVGFSETAFAVRSDDGAWRVRYFAPEQEVDFCGHATIALGAALGEAFGAGRYDLILNTARIPVAANGDGSATLTSPETGSRPLDADIENPVLTAFGLSVDDIDPGIGTRMVNAGNDHVLIGLKSRERLAAMKYDFDSMRDLMLRQSITTIALMVREGDTVFHVRNAFAFGGVVEDPATGAAAAAIAGYLREMELLTFEGGVAGVVFHQGDDMGVPCRIFAAIPEAQASGIDLTGFVRRS